MHKMAVILGAAAFDLGVIVVSVHAAEAPKAPSTQDAATASMFLKIDSVEGEKACAAKGGAVVKAEGKQFCQFPASSASPARK